MHTELWLATRDLAEARVTWVANVNPALFIEGRDYRITLVGSKDDAAVFASRVRAAVEGGP